MTAPAGTRARRARLVHKKPPHLDQVRNEMNVTPLVDVCLVLLIIFMVIMELLGRGKEVALPETHFHESESDQNQPIVAIDKRGKLYFDKEPMDNLDSLKRRVEDEWRANDQASHRVFIKADITLPYGKVYPLIIAMHELEPLALDLGVNEKKEEK